MDKQFIEALQKKYKNLKETRTKDEIQLSIRLTRALTQLNIARVNNPVQVVKPSTTKIPKEEFLYVYCYGSPPSEKELQHVSFPGQTVLIIYTPAKIGQTEEQTKKEPATFKQWAFIMEEKINQASKTKPVILAYHSFGTYIVSTYLEFFPKNRVIGMIDIAGLPLRFHPELHEVVYNLDAIQLKDFEENLDTYFDLYKMSIEQRVKKGDKSINNNILSNKYQLLAFMITFKSEYGIDEAFTKNSMWPPILKCFIYGRNDLLFTESLLSEKAVFYSYKQKWDQNYRQTVSEAYERVTGHKQSNVQEIFVFSIQRGAHSLHMQKKNKDIIGRIMNEYLSTIEEVYALAAAKL